MVQSTYQIAKEQAAQTAQKYQKQGQETWNKAKGFVNAETVGNVALTPCSASFDSSFPFNYDPAMTTRASHP